MVKEIIRRFKRFEFFTAHFVPAFIVFLMMMVLIGFSWRSASKVIAENKTQEITERARYAEINLRQRILLNENTLRAGANLFYESDGVSPAEWKTFVKNLEIENRMPGIIGIGYIEITKSDQLQNLISRVKNQGKPDFKLNLGEAMTDTYAIITMMEPETDRNKQVLGGNIYQDPIRLQTADQARDSGTTAISDVTYVLQENGQRRNSVVLYHPVYRTDLPVNTLEQRRAAIVGFVYAPLNVDNLFQQIFPDNDTDINYTIHDSDKVNEESVLFRYHPMQDDAQYDWVLEDKVNISNQQWVMKFGAKDSIVPAAVRERPKNVIFGGTLFSLIVALMVYLLMQRRTKFIQDKELKNIERAKDDLLSLASHQLRTPATGVKQYLGMVLEGFTGDLQNEQRDILNRAYESNERQLRIINEFLYLAKADADRVVISPQIFDISKLTKQVVEDMYSNIIEAGHTIRVSNKIRSLQAIADVHSARMILENLISNAVKYTPGGGKILVTINKSGNMCSVAVQDNGVGIDEKDFSKLFKQFSRIPNEMTRQTTGSGIGLFLASYLANINGGSIKVESIKGEGSTFTAYFPAKNVKKVTVKPKRKAVV
jgi:signal transduction histidine kinase